MTARSLSVDALLANHAGLALALISIAAGLAFALLAWLLSRTLASVRDELAFVTSCGDITLPTFVVLPIPFPRTPFFRVALHCRFGFYALAGRIDASPRR